MMIQCWFLDHFLASDKMQQFNRQQQDTETPSRHSLCLVEWVYCALCLHLPVWTKDKQVT